METGPREIRAQPGARKMGTGTIEMVRAAFS